jgi:hypothetical protein
MLSVGLNESVYTGSDTTNMSLNCWCALWSGTTARRHFCLTTGMWHVYFNGTVYTLDLYVAELSVMLISHAAMAWVHSGREMGRNSKDNRPWPIEEPSRHLPGGGNWKPWKNISRTGDGRILTYLLRNAQDTSCRISLLQGNGKPFCLWHASSPVGVLTRNWGSNKSQKFIETGNTHSIICEELIGVIPLALKICAKFPNWKSCTVNRMYPKLTHTSSSTAGY